LDFVDKLPIPTRLREPVKRALRGEEFQWPALTPHEVSTLVEHGVAPLLYRAAGVPELRAHAIRAAAVEPLRAHDLADVLESLGKRGIETLILKGAALAYEIYPSPELRPRGDCDLLIAETSIEPAGEVLSAMGFTEMVTSDDEHAIRQAVFMRSGAMGVRHTYDIHWAVANTPLFASVLRFEELCERSVAVPKLAPHARALSLADALLLACIHRVAHHHDSDRLIWLVDIAFLRDRMTAEDHRAFWRRAAEGRVVAICSRSIALANEWLSRPPHDLAEEWLSASEIDREEPSRVFLDRDLTRGGVLIASLRALSWRERIERLWQLGFPPADFVQTSFRTRSRILLPLLYVYRALRGIARLFKRAATFD
jgi:hypothetical protein